MPKAKKKQLDIFNLFYSGAAVIILVGVIAKLLEWPMQETLITWGLGIEAVVFAASAIKFEDIEDESNDDYNPEDISSEYEAVGQKGANLSKNIINFKKRKQFNDISNHIKDIEYSESSWVLLEQMNILSITKEIYFQPIWVNLKSQEYVRLTELFTNLFEKKLPTKETLPFLINFPVKLPIGDINTLNISVPQKIEITDLQILFKSFSMIGSEYFFTNIILEQIENDIIIRSKKDNEIQIYGEVSEQIKIYIDTYHKSNLIFSPKLDFIRKNIYLKDDLLFDYFIENSIIENELEIISLSEILINESDILKVKLWNKYNSIPIDSLNYSGFTLLKAFIQSMLTIKDQNISSNIVASKIEFIIGDSEKYKLEDVVNYSSDIVFFGQDNEYSINLIELFPSSELLKTEYLQSLIIKLNNENVDDIESINKLLNINTKDTAEDLLRKLNRLLAKNKTTATGAQLSFVLLCKVFNNS
jgi:hypothetical protein